MRLRAPALVLATVAVFLVVPLELHHPVDWFALSPRLVPFIWMLGIIALPRARKPVPWWVVAPATAAGIFFGAYLTYDFRTWFMRVEMSGLNRALDSIPPGKRVLGLWPTDPLRQHYTSEGVMHPFLHVANYYVSRRGGFARPRLDGLRRKDVPNVWVKPRIFPPEGGFGRADRFTWDRYGPFWDYFLVKDAPPGITPIPPSLFEDAPAGVVHLVSRNDLWRVYERRE